MYTKVCFVRECMDIMKTLEHVNILQINEAYVIVCRRRYAIILPEMTGKRKLWSF